MKKAPIPAPEKSSKHEEVADTRLSYKVLAHQIEIAKAKFRELKANPETSERDLGYWKGVYVGMETALGTRTGSTNAKAAPVAKEVKPDPVVVPE